MANPHQDDEKIQKVVKRMSSPEEIDQALNLAHPVAWVPLLTILTILFGILVWSFVGRIPEEVTGRGVSLSLKGVFNIQSKTSGIVTDVGVKEGDLIEAGQYVSTIYNPQKKALLAEIQTTLFTIEQQEFELSMLKERLKAREKLFGEGLIAKTVVEDTQSSVIAKEISLEDSKSKIQNLLSQLEEISSGYGEEFDKEEILMILKEGEGLAELENLLSKVTSPNSGKVLEVLISDGEIIEKKKNLVWLEHPKSAEERSYFFAYLPIDVGTKVKPGMAVQIEPSIVNPQEWGSMLGTVEKISAYAISEEEMFSTLKNQQLINYLMDGANAVAEVIIQPELDPNTISGYKWTSKSGPPFQIPTGTVGKVKIIIEEQRPISYLIPIWKLKPENR